MENREEFDYQVLLSAYRTLWANRALAAEENAKETLMEAILRDLKDELTHPRVRKSPYIKFYGASKRILDSDLPFENKCALLKLHAQLMEGLEQSL